MSALFALYLWFLGQAQEQDSAQVQRIVRACSPELREAIPAAVAAVGRPDLKPILWRVAWRESRCTPVGAHPKDGWAGRRVYEGAVARGLLDPERCPAHRLDERTHADFSTRGSFGQIVGRRLKRVGGLLGVECLEPEAFDDPSVAALSAADSMARICRKERGAACCIHTTRVWVGVGRWKHLPLKKRVHSVRRQCGEEGVLVLLLNEVSTQATR